jgi:hypothetical protein
MKRKFANHLLSLILLLGLQCSWNQAQGASKELSAAQRAERYYNVVTRDGRAEGWQGQQLQHQVGSKFAQAVLAIAELPTINGEETDYLFHVIQLGDSMGGDKGMWMPAAQGEQALEKLWQRGDPTINALIRVQLLIELEALNKNDQAKRQLKFNNSRAVYLASLVARVYSPRDPALGKWFRYFLLHPNRFVSQQAYAGFHERFSQSIETLNPFLREMKSVDSETASAYEIYYQRVVLENAFERYKSSRQKPMLETVGIRQGLNRDLKESLESSDAVRANTAREIIQELLVDQGSAVLDRELLTLVGAPASFPAPDFRKESNLALLRDLKAASERIKQKGLSETVSIKVLSILGMKISLDKAAVSDSSPVLNAAVELMEALVEHSPTAFHEHFPNEMERLGKQVEALGFGEMKRRVEALSCGEILRGAVLN